MFASERGGIFITDRIEERAKEIEEAVHPLRCVMFLRDDFKIEDAKEVISEAYKSEENTKTLVLGAKSFTIPSQNALLKILEEPPRNIAFYLIAPSKSVFLPTVRSRLSVTKEQILREYEPLPIELGKLDLAAMFSFVKENDRLKKHEAKALLEQIVHQAVHVEGLALSTFQLEAIEKGFRLIELNARVQSVLVMVMMHFLKETKRAH